MPDPAQPALDFVIQLALAEHAWAIHLINERI